MCKHHKPFKYEGMDDITILQLLLHTRADSQSTGPGSVEPQWGSAGHTVPAFGVAPLPAVVGPGSTSP